MDPLSSAPDAKKARWSPSAGMQQQQHSPSSPHPADPYANYGYGPHSQLYSTPANLTINTQQPQNGMIHPGQGSPNSALFNAQQNGYNAYNMFGMNGMNMLAAANGFNPYNNAAANGFQQVCIFFQRLKNILNTALASAKSTASAAATTTISRPLNQCQCRRC